MLGVDLKDQMLQPYLLERKKSTKWYLKLFKRLLSIEIHDAMVIYRCLPNNRNLDTLKVRLSLAQGLVEEHGSAVHCPVYGRPSLEPPPKRLTQHISWSIFPPQERRQNLKKDVKCAQNVAKGRNRFIGVVNVRQGCV
jgi:hypothetical protein